MVDRFKSSEVFVSEAGTASAVWHIKGWGKNYTNDVFRKGANCQLSVNSPRLAEQVQIRFFLKEYSKKLLIPYINNNNSGENWSPQGATDIFVCDKDCVKLPVGRSPGSQESCCKEQRQQWYDLCADILWNPNSSRTQYGFLITVAILNDALEVQDVLVNGKQVLFERGDPRLKIIHQDFIKGALTDPNGRLVTQMEKPKTSDLFYGIELTLYNVNEADRQLPSKAGAPSSSSPEMNSLSKNLEKMYLSVKTLTDVILESRDGRLINAHKSILSKRDGKLWNLIEKESRKEDYSGTVRIGDVDAKPLIAILHWMYTGELVDGGHQMIGELGEVATKYEMTGLLQLLDTKLIGICTKGNMLKLYDLAEQFGLENAKQYIGAFVKANI